jgi:hypothetical protein
MGIVNRARTSGPQELRRPVWKKGNLLEVSWGYPGDMAPTRQVVIQKVTGFQVLSIEGHATSVLMNKVARCRTFENVRRSDVVLKIAQDNGYGPAQQDIESTEHLLPVITQARMTDAQLLRRLADREGFELYVDFDGLHFHRQAQHLTVELSATVLGDPSLLAKTVVEIQGISQRLSGKYYVKEAKHKLDAGYTVELKCLRDGHGELGGAPSKGKPNRGTAATSDPDALQPVEVVDQETGRTRVEFRDSRGRPAKGGA